MILIKPGTRVKIGYGKESVDGIVTAVMIYSSGVRYYVAYWNGTKLEDQLIEDFLVAPFSSPEDRVEIGFKQ